VVRRSLIVGLALLWGCPGGSGLLGDPTPGPDDDDSGGDDDSAPDPGPPPLCTIAVECPAPIPDEPKIDCMVAIHDGHGELQYDGPAAIERRGRSSQGFPKPQYSVELRDELGLDASANLLGMGADPDWVFNGAYIDRSFFRNKLAFDLHRDFSESSWAPESAFCELALDGDWRGIYLLVEKIKRDDDRIDIPPDDGSGGTFVLKQDEGSGFYEMEMAHGGWRPLYPRPDRMTSVQSDAILAFLAGWEAAVSGPAPSDPDTGIFAFVDLESAVELVIIEEFFKNNDASWLSLHVHKTPATKLHFVPWDLDLSLGQPYYNDNHPPTGWVAYRPPMIRVMAAQPAFHARLVERWAELREGVLAEEAILARIDDYRTTLGDTVYDNFVVWPIEDIQFGDNQLYPVSSYDEEYELVRAWIRDRLVWVDANIADY